MVRPTLFYGCETWLMPLQDEKAIGNKIFGTFGVEMRSNGQKLVKCCTLTHTMTHVAKLVVRMAIIYIEVNNNKVNLSMLYKAVQYSVILNIWHELPTTLNSSKSICLFRKISRQSNAG